MSSIAGIKRASLEETLEFANAVREAGGGATLHALMPAVPEDPEQCLIARNLNFDCYVDDPDGQGWAMNMSDLDTRDAIAEALELEPFETELHYAVRLPAEIGQVAHDFDRATTILGAIQLNIAQNDGEFIPEHFNEDELQLVRDMWPYIEESTKEAYELATVVNDKGEIVI